MENKKALIPRTIIDTRGSVYYDEKGRAWGIIRLKTEVVKEFYQLKEKRAKFSYHMQYYRTHEELEKAIKDLKKNNESLPLLLFLYREEQ